jgi:hypothetical protein
MSTLKCSRGDASLLDKTDVYQSPNEKAVRKHRDYGLVLVLIGMALALVAAKYSRQHPLMEFHWSILNSADVDLSAEVSPAGTFLQ